MAGLLVKDMRLILRNKPYVVLFIILTVMLGFSQEGTFILGYFPYAMMILIINTIGYDEMDNGYQFLMTLPINAKTYVREKYILSLAGAVFSWLIAAILYFAPRALHGTSIEKTRNDNRKQRRKTLINRINKPFVKNHMFCEMQQH